MRTLRHTATAIAPRGLMPALMCGRPCTKSADSSAAEIKMIEQLTKLITNGNF